MKKLIFFEIFIFVTIFSAISMSRPPKTETTVESGTTEITGKVTYFGNVPFEYLAIKADDGKAYKIEIGENCRTPDGKKATESDISKLQGWKIKFIGKIENETFKLTSYEKLP